MSVKKDWIVEMAAKECAGLYFCVMLKDNAIMIDRNFVVLLLTQSRVSIKSFSSMVLCTAPSIITLFAVTLFSAFSPPVLVR